MDKNELHALILVIFKGNQEQFIRFCEDKKSSVGKLEYVDKNVRQGYRRNLILWNILFFSSVIASLAVPFLLVVFMAWYSVFIAVFLIIFFVMCAVGTESKMKDYENKLSYSTDSEDKYDRYLKECYPLLESKNNEKCSQYENFLKCSQKMEQHKADIDNQKKRPQDCTDDHSKSKYPDSEPVECIDKLLTDKSLADKELFKPK